MAGAALPLAAARRAVEPLGLELYSLRGEAEKDLRKALELTRDMGFREIETGSFYGRTLDQFQRLLEAHDLKVTALMAEWPELEKGTAEAAERALALQSKFVVTSNIPHKRKQFTLDDAKRASDNFNKWGQALAKHGLRFCYHTHGFEFGPGPDGTLFDSMLKLMDPKFANFEMDVFWIVFGKQDPARMLAANPGRFPLLHLKDIRKGEAKTGDPGDVVEEASVVLGTGEVDWPSVLRAARASGVKHYYIEEEHPDAVQQIPQSLEYLKNL
jgi:sugar phosphate isomerase/epimerase